MKKLKELQFLRLELSNFLKYDPNTDHRRASVCDANAGGAQICTLGLAMTLNQSSRPSAVKTAKTGPNRQSNKAWR